MRPAPISGVNIDHQVITLHIHEPVSANQRVCHLPARISTFCIMGRWRGSNLTPTIMARPGCVGVTSNLHAHRSAVWAEPGAPEFLRPSPLDQIECRRGWKGSNVPGKFNRFIYFCAPLGFAGGAKPGGDLGPFSTAGGRWETLFYCLLAQSENEMWRVILHSETV